MCVCVCVCVCVCDAISVAQHLQKTFLRMNFRKFLPKTQYQSNKITNKNYIYSKRSTLETNNLNSIELISNQVLMYSNVFSYCCY